MMSSLSHVNRLLECWGKWRRSANNSGVGWSNETILQKMMRHGQLIKSTAPAYTDEDAVSEKINMIVIAIGMFKREQAKALITYYENPSLTIEDCAARLKIPSGTFADRLRAGKKSVLRAVTDKEDF